MFDPRDYGTDPRTRPAPAPRRDYTKDRQRRSRDGHRREYDPATKRERIKDRTDRAVADVGIYRSVAYRDVAEAHFDGHPYAARRAVDHAIRAGNMREHVVKGPQGGTFKVLTLTEQGARRAERIAQQQGLDAGQRAWSGMVKTKELRHDVAVFRAARTEQVKLLEQGATIKRVRIDAELKAAGGACGGNRQGERGQGGGGRGADRGGGGVRVARQKWQGRVSRRADRISRR